MFSSWSALVLHHENVFHKYVRIHSASISTKLPWNHSPCYEYTSISITSVKILIRTNHHRKMLVIVSKVCFTVASKFLHGSKSYKKLNKLDCASIRAGQRIPGRNLLQILNTQNGKLKTEHIWDTFYICLYRWRNYQSHFITEQFGRKSTVQNAFLI